uniref:Uncharacterized protein n=1 Tax=Arcella intermedia TaxID=1963864 RepID=A0A6B2LPT7_9EUKA
MRLSDDTFTESYLSTIGVDFKIRNVEVENKVIKLQIWDTAGQERFRTITSSYYKGAHGIMVLYDVTSRESFANVEHWFQEVSKYGTENVKILLVGNKCDTVFERKVTTVQGEGLAQKHNALFIETSARTNTNVEEAFLKLALAVKSSYSL